MTTLQFSLTNPPLSQRNKGVIIAVVAAILMSFDPIFIRLSEVDGFDTAFLFGLFSALSIAVVMQFQQKQSIVTSVKKAGWPAIVSGGLMLISASAMIMSIKHTAVANVFVILSATPLFAAITSWLLMGEVTRRSTWLAMISVGVGIGIVVSGSFEAGHWLGDGLALLSAAFIGINQAYLRKHQQVSRLASVGLGSGFMAIVFFFIVTPSEYSITTWLVMAMMGLFTAPFGRVLSHVATRYITAPEVGILLLIEAILAPLFAWFAFTELPPLNTLIGGLIILITIYIYVLNSNK